MDGGPSTDDLDGLIARYERAWNAGDLNRIADAYATPCFVVKNGRVLRHEGEEAKRSYFADLLARNQQQGTHAWSTNDREIRLLGANAALVTVRWTCRRPDGSTIWDFRDSYLFAADRGRWEILGDVVHD